MWDLILVKTFYSHNLYHAQLQCDEYAIRLYRREKFTRMHNFINKLIDGFQWLLVLQWLNSTENPLSRTLKSREFGGSHIKRISKPSSLAAWQNSTSLWSIFALSCWINIGYLEFSLGQFSLIMDMTFSIKNALMTSHLTEAIGLVSIVPATLLTLVLLAASCVKNVNTPVFPEKSSLTCSSNLGRAIATKNTPSQ